MTDNHRNVGKAERADKGQWEFIELQYRRHRCKLSFRQRIHQRRFEDIVQVVAERNFIKTVLLRVFAQLQPALTGTPPAVHLFTGFKPLKHRNGFNG